ncbi:MAG: SDR family oxidoreductase [Hyphomicrobiales bacterium]|nr:SDR family oxidoreductase [Hyphomicrobiales bacterium]
MNGVIIIGSINTETRTLKNKHLLILGFGYSAAAIGKKLHGRFDKIYVTNRTHTTSSDDPFDHLVFDGNEMSDELRNAILSATHVLISIGPDENGDPVVNSCRDAIMAANEIEWAGYLSTVGVYGNHDGLWVNEDTVCKPVSARSKQRLKAEKAWQDIAKQKNIPLTIFRLSGIYGPGRNAFVNIDNGRSRRLVKKGQVFNRIHRDDIANAMKIAIAKKASGIFNISDDEPAPPQDVVTYVHQLRNLKPPAEIDFETAEISPMARSFYGENKKVSNAKSKSELGLDYDWPNYRLAFDAMWKNGDWK